MSKKKTKNSNYVTEKATEAKLKREKERKAKKTKKLVRQILIIALAVIIAAGAFTGLGFAFGWWDYVPTPTYHATIEVEGYGSLHVELYGEDASDSVNAFVEYAEDGFFDGKSFDALFGEVGIQCSANGAETIKLEYNNTVDNKIPFTKGTLAMLPINADDPSKTGGAFFILTENEKKLGDSYAAFGRVTEGLDIIEDIEKDLKKGGTAPVIKSVTVHEAH